MKYTEEQTLEMIELYKANPTQETVELLAEKYDRSNKSIIGKLSVEGVYRKKVYTTKTGEKVVTKLELVADIEKVLELEHLEGLEKAPKATLKRLLDALSVEC